MMSFNLIANSQLSPLAQRQNVQQPFFVSNVIEEIGGRPIPGVPIKIMGHNPRTVGEQLAKLVRARFRELRPETIETMPRTRMIALQLKSSYLMIRFEFPSDGPGVKNQSVVFSRFVKGFASALEQLGSQQQDIQRGRKHPFWIQ
jgi:hypothetical protein